MREAVSRRFGNLLVSGVIFLAACLGFAHLWSVRVDAALAQVRQGMQAVATDVEAMAHGAVTGVQVLRTAAEAGLARPLPAGGASLPPLVVQEGRFFTRYEPDQVPDRSSSYLFGLGGVPEHDSGAAREMAAALALNGLMADLRERIAPAAWVYYTSAGKFTNLYPYREVRERLAWSETFLQHHVFADTGPQRNPSRGIRWEAAYLDQAGLGLMTSVVAPVYDPEGGFRAIVALDFTLDSLARFLQIPGPDLPGRMFLVNREGQVLLAAPALAAGRLWRLDDVLPAGLAAEMLFGVASGECGIHGAWRSCSVDLQEAPWRLVRLVDARQLGWQMLAEMQVEIAGLFLLFLLLVAVERHRRLAEVLREGDARYRRIIEGSEQGFWDWNIRTRGFAASPRFDSILGYDADTSPLRGESGWQQVHPEERDALRRAIRRHLLGREPFLQMEFRARSRTGCWQWLQVQGRIVEREAGRPVMMSGTLTDISGRKQSEADLIAAKQAAEAANVAKSRFLAAASHDLRQPLQASNLFVSALGRTPLNEEQQKIAHNLGLATKALGELLDALLDISKLDAGVVTPQLAPVEIYEIFQRIESEFASLAVEKDLRFKLFFPARPLIFETDLGLLMGLLRNLVGNAIRYTEWGGVLVGTRMRQGCLVIQVWDTGIGIHEENLPRIYEEFFQVDNPQRDRVKGLGLGLSIVRRMASLLGYRIDCKSRYGRGTVFEISIPLEGRAGPARPRSGKPTARVDTGVLKGRSCVLIEDDQLVADALESWLGSHGMRLQHFSDADSALKDPHIAEADFYVTDFRMPGERNGIELLDSIRRLRGGPIRALIVTGDTSMEQIDAFAAAGWPVLHKPIDPQQLLERMASME
ncbi:ATP-binding protein [Azovibrio restrictus]|uniref:ATP-binding protein n=1 Tax=Azovibrio restrictus TaxID=146938 RepID=UPI0026EE8058|nr:ATP-binding protein [Azovibrio restrictus]